MVAVNLKIYDLFYYLATDLKLDKLVGVGYLN